MINEIHFNKIKINSQREDTPKKKKSKSLQKNNQPNIITQISSSNNNYLTKSNFHINSFTPTNRINNINSQKLLPPQKKTNKKTLVLDLDETLVHSSFIPFEENDIILEVEFDNVLYNIYVLVRPNALQFLINMSKYYEIVIFTASLSKYANPLLDIIDPKKVCSYRLFRDHCTLINGIFIKELKRLNRNIKDIIIVDNSPSSYAFNPQNGIPIKSWFDDRKDNELEKLEPFLQFLSKVDDVKLYIPFVIKENEIDFIEIKNIIERGIEKNINCNIQKQEEEEKSNCISINCDNYSYKNINPISMKEEEKNINNLKKRVRDINKNKKKIIKNQYSFRLGINTNSTSNLNNTNINNFKTGTLYDKFVPLLPLSLSNSTKKNNVKIHSIQFINDNKIRRQKINNIHPIKMKNINENEKNLLPLMNKNINEQKIDSLISKSLKLKMSSSQSNYKTIFTLGTSLQGKRQKLEKTIEKEKDIPRSNSTGYFMKDYKLQNSKITLKKTLSKNYKTTRDFKNIFKLPKTNNLSISTKNTNNKKFNIGKDYFIKEKKKNYI